ncbi:hypothetical protein JHK82_015832 [Glycine max]|uniref:Bifunctional inhibitor/plant lipid transfer protein/seed storage helical domain-containing protein n=1 Tax=Glycine soja TaxID=3848 RepID=A0A0B2QCT4_GLYSO|nr:hypothetical protein JHK87_015779 [Glycine soja]KAG5032256.1 hypothetical protein JHK85_016238 [Glycine max]KAG5046453.1 hypothetical protein JHK86_015859 [Glycine max]KAG5148951.1 hypothetical protein JHK82_015832 [Glycine max]KHN17823.1 hypothetical protein glysoja_029131 [Glycine soja]
MEVTTFIACLVPPTCNGYGPLLIQCVPYLVNRGSSTLTPHCCDGARVAFQRANNAQAIKNFCSCLVDVGPYLGFQNQNLVLLPGACDIKL